MSLIDKHPTPLPPPFKNRNTSTRSTRRPLRIIHISEFGPEQLSQPNSRLQNHICRRYYCGRQNLPGPGLGSTAALTAWHLPRFRSVTHFPNPCSSPWLHSLYFSEKRYRIIKGTLGKSCQERRRSTQQEKQETWRPRLRAGVLGGGCTRRTHPRRPSLAEDKGWPRSHLITTTYSTDFQQH
jgi:hypothetical protein